MSRIRIISIVRVYADGTYNHDDIEVTDIEFPDMYRTGILATHAGEQTADAGDPVFPEVVTETIPAQEKGLFVGFERIYEVYAAAGGLPIYVPPFKFTEAGKFAIGHIGSNVQGGGELTYNTYYGDLGAITLNRDEYKQELRAGESMDIMLELKDDEISGIYVYISPWNTEPNTDLLQHPYPGIYSAEELLAMRNAVVSGKNIPESMYVTENGQKVIRIYNDIFVPLTGESTIPVPDGYILDGMGHDVTSSGKLSIAGTVRDLSVNGAAVY